jgi:hypothetical protein
MHEHVDGIPDWSADSPPVCGHCSPSASEDSSPQSVEELPSPKSVEELLLAPDDRSAIICHLTRDQLRLLWHQRFGHIHSRRISDMHRHADGVPKIVIASELDIYPICAQAKLRKAARGQEDSRRFIVQRSSGTSRIKRLRGLNGEICYCFIVQRSSDTSRIKRLRGLNGETCY